MLRMQQQETKMSLNIVVETIEGFEHPAWDAVRHGPDRVIAAILTSLPSIEICDYEGDQLLRPANFTLWRNAAPDDSEARSRYLELMKILETEPNYWLHLSY
ncbi:hypothetical protein EFD55_06225 [Rhizobium pisi]|uniref:Uncharacterized protein n=2 Tax=Rhizobium pisi TaxID=574561 RepID=A0A3R9BPZ9_9HYPH|nr:hypothetical protein EFD55_06225 [Rhizobium pisi]